MYQLGIFLFLISSIIIFGADKMFKSGKITSIKKLLIIKLSGLGLTIASVIMMIYGK